MFAGEEHPNCAALVETAGAIVRWDVRAMQDPPEIVATEVDFGTAGIMLSTGEIDALRRLAWLTWAEAWWPAGRRVAPLSRALVRAESAVATAAVSHLLDDDESVERALEAAAEARAPAALRALAVHESAALSTGAHELLDQLFELADDFGVPLDSPADADRTDTGGVGVGTGAGTDAESAGTETERAGAHREGWALAAGASHLPGGSGSPVVAGRSPIPWSGLPAGVLDAEAEAVWELSQLGGTLRFRVSVAAAPEVTFPLPEPRVSARLAAVYGPESLGVEAPMRLTGDAYVAEETVPTMAMLLPPADRGVRVGDIRFTATSPAGTHGAAPTDLIVLAETRLNLVRADPGSDEATLAERAAALSAPEAAA